MAFIHMLRIVKRAYKRNWGETEYVGKKATVAEEEAMDIPDALLVVASYALQPD